MRGEEHKQAAMFSYITLEQRIPADHPARQIRAMVDRGLSDLDEDFDKLYASTGRPSISPEQLLRAQLLVILYSIRLETQLIEQLHYNLLYRWFVGLEMDDAVWVPTRSIRKSRLSRRCVSARLRRM